MTTQPEGVVDRAKAALEGVTPGPWVSWKSRRDDGLPYYTGNVTSDATKQIVFTQTGNTANTQFVAAARTLVPELVAEVERLRRERKAMADQLDLWLRGHPLTVERKTAIASLLSAVSGECDTKPNPTTTYRNVIGERKQHK